MEWSLVKRRFGNEQRLMLGRIAVCCVSRTVWGTKGSNLTHVSIINLPGIKKDFANKEHASEQDAKDYAEKIIEKWIDSAGLKVKEPSTE